VIVDRMRKEVLYMSQFIKAYEEVEKSINIDWGDDGFTVNERYDFKVESSQILTWPSDFYNGEETVFKSVQFGHKVVVRKDNDLNRHEFLVDWQGWHEKSQSHTYQLKKVESVDIGDTREAIQKFLPTFLVYVI